MQYRKKNSAFATEIFLEDKLLSQHCDEFSLLIDEFTKSPQIRLIINLENTSALDTGGLASLLLGLQKITDAAKTLILRNPRNGVKDTLRLMNFETLFQIEFAS